MKPHFVIVINGRPARFGTFIRMPKKQLREYLMRFPIHWAEA